MYGFQNCPECMEDCNDYVMVNRPFTLAAFAAESIFFHMRDRYGYRAAKAIRELDVPETCKKDIREIQEIHAFFHIYARGAMRTFLGAEDEEAEAQEEAEEREEVSVQEEDETQEELESLDESEATETDETQEELEPLNESEAMETEEHQETVEDEPETDCCIRINRNTCQIL